MDNTMALLLSDTYKQCHDRMYPKGLKKSHKGCCKVYEENGELLCQYGFMDMVDDSLLATVFKDGKLVKEENFMDIRKRMYGGKDV